MKKQAIGLIETYGYVAAIEAADASLKAANVSLLHWEKVTGGLVTIKVTGDVGAVQAAVQAAGIAAAKVGKLVATHVIPRPAFEVERFFCSGTEEKGLPHQANQMKVVEETGPSRESDATPKVDEEAALIEETATESLVNDLYQTEEELNEMKVVDLRTLARQLPGVALDKHKIKFARKDELIEAILALYKGGKT